MALINNLDMAVDISAKTTVAEPSCSRCAHRDVCSHKEDYAKVVAAIRNATVSSGDLDGGITSKKIINYDFVHTITVNCRYYHNWTAAYREVE